MDQLQLLPPAKDFELPWSTVKRAGPIVDLGTAKAIQVWTDDDGEYLAKGIKFDSGLTPWGPANELIAALLATTLGLPINPFSLITYGEDVLFGTRWMDKDSYTYCTDLATLEACENAEAIYDILAFDVLVCNADRHQMNFIARRQKHVRQTQRYILTANDHDRCLMAPDVEPFALDEWWSHRPLRSFIRAPFVFQAITEAARLDGAIQRIEALTESEIRSSVNRVPDKLLGLAEKRPIQQFLIRRRPAVREIIRQGLVLFPKLEGTLP